MMPFAKNRSKGRVVNQLIHEHEDKQLQIATENKTYWSEFKAATRPWDQAIWLQIRFSISFCCPLVKIWSDNNCGN